MLLGLGIFNGLLAVVTLLPLWRNPHYLVRGWDFPRRQIAVALIAAITVQLFAGHWHSIAELTVLGVALASLTVQLWWITPYFTIASSEVAMTKQHDPQRSIRLFTANVLQTNRRTDDFLALVHESQPDIVIALEANAWWQTKLDPLESDGYTHTMKCPLDNLYGMVVYSRLPLSGASTEFLVEDDIPSMHMIATLRSGEKVRLHVLHPPPPSPSENETSKTRDAELIIVAKRVRHANLPAIVAGDLNDVAWSETTRLFRKISRMLDPRVGRGTFSSYHAKYPFMRWPLDHLFHSRHFCLNEIHRLAAFGSDHFPLLIDLQLDDAHSDENGDGISADAGEQAWANEKTAQKNVDAGDVPSPT